MQDQGHSRSRTSNVNVTEGQCYLSSRPLKVKVILVQGQLRSLKVKIISWSRPSQGDRCKVKVILESNSKCVSISILKRAVGFRPNAYRYLFRNSIT